METATETDPTATTIRLTGKIEKRSVLRGGRARAVYDGACGKVEISAEPSRAAVSAALSAKVAAFLDGYGSPVVLWSLDGRECWIAFPTPEGWGYAITDAGRAWNMRTGATVYATCGREWSRDECLEHMRQHWYALNAAYIVDGIVGLCTDQREWNCKACGSVQRSGAPYLCRNPACGAPAPAFEW